MTVSTARVGASLTSLAPSALVGPRAFENGSSGHLALAPLDAEAPPLRLESSSALLGTVAAYVGLIGWFRSNALEGGVSDIIDHVPWDNLFFILIAMPVVAVLIGWALAGREPTGIGTRPLE